MRNLDECRAEIFWRSQVKINERRRRVKRILACCIPLVLCAAVFAAVEFSGVRDIANDSGMSQELGGVNGGAVFLFVSGEGVRQQITDPAQVEEVYEQLCLLFSSDGDSSGSDENYGGGGLPVRPPEGSPDHGEGYTIIFFDSAEEEETYTLTGSQLYHEQTGQAVELTDAQLHRLKAALGLFEQ